MNGFKALIKRFSSKKSIVIMALGFIGVLFIMLSSIELPEKTAEEPDFAVETEERLREMIESVEGAGKTRVMVTLKNSGEQIYKETDEDGVVVVNGKNGNEALIKETLYPEIQGVLVVCEGGGSAAVREEIINLISAVYNVGKNSICVCKLSE